MTSSADLLQKMTETALRHYAIDAIYLYGSQAQHRARADSDWDIGILFSDYLSDPSERVLRPQQLEALLERNLKAYGKISIVDLEIVPPPLQYNIIRGERIFDRCVPHVKNIEHAIISTIEKDYDGAA